MKKLIIIATIAVAASFSQAASMSWKVVTTDTGLTVYLCKSVKAFESAAEVAAAVYGTSDNSGTTKANGRGGSAWNGYGATAGGIADSDVGVQTVYGVIISSDGKGYWAVSGSGEVYTTAESPAMASIDAKAAMGSAYTPWAVPEPTSGVLLLLGMAGLALKRKRT